MATVKDQTSKMTLRVATGIGADGKTTFANRSLSNVNPAIQANDFVAVASGLASLQSHDLGSIIRTDATTYEAE